MEEPLYRVVFAGELTGEVDEKTARKQFARLFHLNKHKVKALFSGKEFVIKSNVSEELAMKYAIRIAETGCECFVELVPAENDISQESGFEERRYGERRVRFRRGPRVGAVIPDRRLLQGRRRLDTLELAKTTAHDTTDRP